MPKLRPNEDKLRAMYREMNDMVSGISSGDVVLGFAGALEEIVDRKLLDMEQAGNLMARAFHLTMVLSQRGPKEDVLDVLFGPEGMDVPE